MRLIDADVLEEILTTAIRNMRGMAKFIGAEDDPEIKMEIKTYTDILEGVKKLPTVDADNGWIPVEDKLPEENGEYLVTRESAFYRYIDIVRKSNCNSDLPMASDIKAWMPLPPAFNPKGGQMNHKPTSEFTAKADAQEEEKHDND